MSGINLLEELIRCLQNGTTGAVEWKDGQRHRLFFFEGGELVLVQSNLASESPKRISELHPSLSPDEQAKLTVETRIRAALTEKTGVVRQLPGQLPPRRSPVDLVALLWLVVDLLPRPPFNTWPRVGARFTWIERLQLQPGLVAYLRNLDGSRAMDEVLAFAPGKPDIVDRVFRLAYLLGIIDDVGHEASSSTVTVSRNLGQQTMQISMGAVMNAPPPPPSLRARLGEVVDRIEQAQDPFTMLGVQLDDSTDVVRKAYVTLAQELHPDRYIQTPELHKEAEILFDRVRGAWEIISDPKKKEAYITEKEQIERRGKVIEHLIATADADTAFRRGLLELSSGRVMQAHSHFAQAIQISPEDVQYHAYLSYTTVRIHLGKNEAVVKAAYDRLRAIAMEAGVDRYWVLLGQAERALGNAPQARRAFLKALELKPSNPEALRELKRVDQETKKNNDSDSSFLGRIFGKR